VTNGAGRRSLSRLCRVLCLLAVAAVVAVVAVVASPARVAAVTRAGTRPVTLTLTGTVVRAELSGFEPDFDPIDRVVIAATLRDTRPPAHALPDALLVLSAYLENFQPDTTPLLPDLLHPDRTATALGGFMQGKAVLVNRGGRTGYRGSLLVEVFRDNSAHLVLDVDREGASARAPSLRLKGALTLYKDLSVRGQLRAERPLSAAETAALRVPPGRMPSWQQVVRGLSVRLPPMRGTGGGNGGNPGASRTSLSSALPRVARAPSRPRPSPVVPARTLTAGGALAALIVAALLWRRGTRAKEPSHPA